MRPAAFFSANSSLPGYWRATHAFSWIRSRLRNRPDPEHEMTVNRLMLSGLAFAYIGGVIATTPFWQEHLGLAAGLIAGLIFLPLYVSTPIRKLSKEKRQAEVASHAKSVFLASTCACPCQASTTVNNAPILFSCVALPT